MRDAVSLAVHTALHSRCRDSPHSRVQVKLCPFRRPQFARSLEQHGGKLQRRPDNRPALIAADHAHQSTQFCGVSNGGKVFAVVGLQRAAYIGAYVPHCPARGNRIAPHLPRRGQYPVGHVQRAALFHPAHGGQQLDSLNFPNVPHA